MVRLPDPEAPDPFTRAEIKQILETHTSRTQKLMMIQFMIWAGARVSETIALAWEDIDLEQGTVTFRRSKVRGAYRVTKIRRSTRKVRLLAPAWDALQKIDALNRNRKADTVDIVERVLQDGTETQTALRLPEYEKRSAAHQRLRGA